jgi:mono/diheme cytochrome c family protein
MTSKTKLGLLAGSGLVAVALSGSLQGQGKTASDIYLDKCAVCHGEDGAGKTAKGKKLKVKDVREQVTKMTVEQMVEEVTKGKEPDMDAFGKDYKPEQIRELVAYYRDLAKKK